MSEILTLPWESQATERGYRIRGTVTAGFIIIRVEHLICSLPGENHVHRAGWLIRSELSVWFPTSLAAAQEVIGRHCDVYDPELRPAVEDFLKRWFASLDVIEPQEVLSEAPPSTGLN